MKLSEKIVCLTVLGLLDINLSMGQTKPLITPQPIAYLTINGEKLGNPNGYIDLSTSFFIKHIEMDEKTKQQHISAILTKNKSFSFLKLIDITENKNTSDKGLMVEIGITAIDNADLTSKIKLLLNELNVNSVNYNSTEYKLPDFKF